MANLCSHERCSIWKRDVSTRVFGLLVLGCVWISGAVAASGTAQTTMQAPASAASSAPSTTLPADVSGAYAFDHNNESIDIDLDRRGKLTGFITRLGDEETDSNTPLTYFFDQTAVQGDQLQFETKVVHGLWYSFIGTIVRGSGQVRNDEGYYILRGTLSVHHPSNERDKSSQETVEQRKVKYKSLAQ
ncbi:MAG TPA: hypothetical protein VMU62_02385 [Acidobacteriaceae bacterium]|nr:hypothetical protein [Acidobacteriaceae bacterium]